MKATHVNPKFRASSGSVTVRVGPDVVEPLTAEGTADGEKAEQKTEQKPQEKAEGTVDGEKAEHTPSHGPRDRSGPRGLKSSAMPSTALEIAQAARNAAGHAKRQADQVQEVASLTTKADQAARQLALDAMVNSKWFEVLATEAEEAAALEPEEAAATAFLDALPRTRSRSRDRDNKEVDNERQALS